MSRFSNSITQEAYSQITDYITSQADEMDLDNLLDSFGAITPLQDWVRDFCNGTDGEDLDSSIYEEGFNTICWIELKVALVTFVESLISKLESEEEMLQDFEQALEEDSEEEAERKRQSIDILLEGQKALAKLSS